MDKVIWTEGALNDVHSIWEYVSRDSVANANELQQTLFESTRRLATFPHSGRVVPEYGSENHREVISGSYRIMYTFDESNRRLEVLAVIHAARRLPELL